MTDIPEAAALRAFILDLLVEMPTELLSTPEGRAEVAATYERRAEGQHPAVAEVLRAAAWTVRSRSWNTY